MKIYKVHHLTDVYTSDRVTFDGTFECTLVDYKREIVHN